MTRRISVRDVFSIVAVAELVFVGCCLVGPGGLLTSWHAADVSYFGQLGAHLRSGEIPYRTLYVEYPPGALPIFVLPSLVSQAHYVDLFKVLMTVVGVATIGVTAAAATALDVSRRDLIVVLAPLAAAPILLGSVVLNRFDLWPALLTIAALAALLRARPITGAVGLALAVVAKIFAAATVPVVAVYLTRTTRSAVRRAAIVFASVIALVGLPFAVLGPGGFGFSFYIQITRHLEIESLAASVLLAADRLGLYHARLVDGTPGSRDLAGTLPTVLGVATGLVAVTALLAPAFWLAKGSPGLAALVPAFAAALVGYVAFGKVLSPQYMVWLLPVVPLVRGRRGYAAAALLVISLVLTRLEFSDWDSINRVGPAVWLLLARNLTIAALFFVLGAEVRRGSSPSSA